MTNHRISVTLELTESELRDLADQACRFGWLREEPRKAWSIREYKEAARYAVEHFSRIHLDRVPS